MATLDELDPGLSSIDAEKALIGGLLHDTTRTREMAGIVAPGDFSSLSLGGLYSLMVGRAAAGEPIDPVTLWPHIQADETLARNIPSAVMLHDLMEASPTSANVDYYARQVSEAGQSRRLRAAAVRLAQLADGTGITAGEKLAAARSELDAIAADYQSNTNAPTLAELLAKPDSEIKWVIPQLLGERDRMMITGFEGMGKMTWMRQIMICSAAGIHPITFEPMRPLTALVVDVENSEDQWRWETRWMRNQARQYGSADPGENIRIRCSGRINITSERDLAEIHALLDQESVDLFAIGPIYKLHPRGLNGEEEASAVTTALDSIRDRPDGPAMLIEAHAGHATNSVGERAVRPRGSSTQMGWPEIGVGLAPDPDDDTETVALVKRWRNNRVKGRHVPTEMRSGGDWPWMEDGAALNWIRIKSGMERSRQEETRHTT